MSKQIFTYNVILDSRISSQISVHSVEELAEELANVAHFMKYTKEMTIEVFSRNVPEQTKTDNS